MTTRCATLTQARESVRLLRGPTITNIARPVVHDESRLNLPFARQQSHQTALADGQTMARIAAVMVTDAIG
jgi:hypothetical protein